MGFTNQFYCKYKVEIHIGFYYQKFINKDHRTHEWPWYIAYPDNIIHSLNGKICRPTNLKNTLAKIIRSSIPQLQGLIYSWGEFSKNKKCKILHIDVKEGMWNLNQHQKPLFFKKWKKRWLEQKLTYCRSHFELNNTFRITMVIYYEKIICFSVYMSKW